MVIILLSAGLLGCALYLILLQRELRRLNRQLKRRLEEASRQPLSLELLNPELNQLASHINQCLKAEESLRLEAVREEKRFKELISHLSHDLRTPLTAIKGYLQLMAREELTMAQTDKLTVVQKHADILGERAEQFFEYAVLASAEQEPNMAHVSLNRLVAECLAAAVPDFEQRQMEVALEETEQLFIWADAELTARLLQNLIRNAITHAAGDLQIRIEAEHGKAAIVFCNPVAAGIRIDPERLFERFYTTDQARTGKGAGLGLHIVKLLAEQMGGHVGAAMQDRELEIRVYLPLSGVYLAVQARGSGFNCRR